MGNVEIYHNEHFVKCYRFKNRAEAKSKVTIALKELSRFHGQHNYIKVVYDEPIEDRESKQYPIQQTDVKGNVISYFTNINDAVAKTGISKVSIQSSVIKNHLFAKKYYFKKIEI